MGIPFLWPFVKKNGYLPKLLPQCPQNSRPPDTTYLVDILGAFYPLIRRTFLNHGETPNSVFEKGLRNLRFPPATTVLYMDGPTPEEKRNTREVRQTRCTAGLLNADASLQEMEQLHQQGKKLKKSHFRKLNKAFNAAFYFSAAQRSSLSRYLREKGWIVIDCPSEADVQIALDCKTDDVVVSCDSDSLIHESSITTIWRPLARGEYLEYHIPSILEELDLSRVSLTALGIVCRNDYTSNLKQMGLATNYKILKDLEGEDVSLDVEELVRSYMTHPQVVRKSPAMAHFDSALKVFAYQQFTLWDPSQDNAPREPYPVLGELLTRRRNLQKELKSKSESRAHGSSTPHTSDDEHSFNRYSTVDRAPESPPPPHASGKKYKYRQRYAVKTRSRIIEHDPPDIFKQHIWKPWTEPPQSPAAPNTPPKPETTTTTTKKGSPSLDGMTKKGLVKELQWQHPIRVLDIGTINSNVTRALNKESLPPACLTSIKVCLSETTRLATVTKRICQQAIGQYLEGLSLENLDDQDRLILQVLCRPFTDRDQLPDSEVVSEDVVDREDEDEQQNQIDESADITDDKNAKNEALQFFFSLLSAIYNAKPPRMTLATRTADLAKYAIPKRNESNIEPSNTESAEGGVLNPNLPSTNQPNTNASSPQSPPKTKGTKTESISVSAVRAFLVKAKDILPPQNEIALGPYPSSTILRSTAINLFVEFLNHYKTGSIDLCKKIRALKKKGRLPADSLDNIDLNMSPAQNFLNLNKIAGSPRCLVPMSYMETLFINLSELDLVKVFWHDPLLKRQLQEFAFPTVNLKKVEQVPMYVVDLWLGDIEPGHLVNKMITDIGSYSLEERKKRKNFARTTKRMSLLEIRNHLRTLRQADFHPRNYGNFGYLLRGSIRTDGFRLQLLGFKLNELNCVKFRRLPPERLPESITSTLGGTGHYLTEIRNVIKSESDVRRLWPGVNAQDIKVLGIDMGQAFVVGASALLPPPTKADTVSNAKLDSTPEAKSDTVSKSKSRAAPEKTYFHNLSIKQKAVYQPTFRHRNWLQRRKGRPPAEGMQSMAQIESSLPHRHGPEASIKDYVRRLNEVEDQFQEFYGKAAIKKHKWNARKARRQEFRTIANRLLGLVGGSIGARRDESNHVIIGIGLSSFSSKMRLSSLDGSFLAYFVQLARSLGYVVVGVNEFYTSKKCPGCEGFVGQVDLRRLYCPKCKVYMHRDVMAGHNMANIVRSHLVSQQRPKYLQPVDVNGEYPWEDGRGGGGKRYPGAAPAIVGSKRKAPVEWTDTKQDPDKDKEANEE
ncbi:hypothetical protein EMPS_00083 [Entomortierella parvispora]|uniref:Cas12f1-like TNB domain-containing protein n=1 Tax=Entomortierella parvispora TaxID=205924 RepID=A0A9P3GZK9_9FUNG|nr:hypothetical protein EMPS_00083 [Entomortierella parvispora]